MVAMDFFAALNCYDFLNQYCSNLLKNPTVRGLSHKSVSSNEIISWKITCETVSVIQLYECTK